jgi:hypothetical protein
VKAECGADTIRFASGGVEFMPVWHGFASWRIKHATVKGLAIFWVAKEAQNPSFVYV